jgi:hypothetical protein
MKKRILPFIGFLAANIAFAQVGINTANPNVTLEVNAIKTDGTTAEGVIYPRMTGNDLRTADLNAKYGQPQDGVIVFVIEPPVPANRVGQTIDIDVRGYYYYDYPENKWIKVLNGNIAGTITSLDCPGATVTGSLVPVLPASGVSVNVDYTGGNGGTYGAQTIPSTGVIGLTANLQAGSFANGFGTLTFTITGTPNTTGTATFPVSIGGQSCSFTALVQSGRVSTLDCAGAVTSGSLSAGTPASNVTTTINYTGGNGGSYPAQTVSSTGVTGLTANLPAGSVNGNGSVIYTITGVPSNSGTATFAISLGGESCSFTINVGAAQPTGSGSFTGATCFDVAETNDGGECGLLANRILHKADFSQTSTNSQIYTFTPSGAVSNVRFVYSNTNGQVITNLSGGNPGTNITTPVTATVSYNTALNSLAAGATRAGALTATIAVIYNNAANGTGTDVQLILKVFVQDCSCCGAYVSATEWRAFMCHNLGADETADPFVPSAAIHGAKYKWGYSTASLTQAEDQANSGAIPGFPTSYEGPVDLWLDNVKTANDPCPAGYRVPTGAQWLGAISHNNVTRVGTFTWSPNEYNSAFKIGEYLLLPTAGKRMNQTGQYDGRGAGAHYWSSTSDHWRQPEYYFRPYRYSLAGDPNTIRVGVNNTIGTAGGQLAVGDGLSVRCISE